MMTREQATERKFWLKIARLVHRINSLPRRTVLQLPPSLFGSQTEICSWRTPELEPGSLPWLHTARPMGLCLLVRAFTSKSHLLMQRFELLTKCFGPQPIPARDGYWWSTTTNRDEYWWSTTTKAGADARLYAALLLAEMARDLPDIPDLATYTGESPS